MKYALLGLYFCLHFPIFFGYTRAACKKRRACTHSERSLHHLEKIVALAALAAVLALTIGFAQAADPDSRAPKNPRHEVFLRSAVALVQDATSGETLIAKNQGAILPIASITKLMTAMVILDAGVNLEQRVAISGEDYDFVKGTRSRLRPGTVLTRDELLLLALMSSENRAASSLGAHLSGRHRGLRRGDERQGAGARHDRHALRRSDRPVLQQRVERAATWRGWSPPRTSIR